MQLPREIRMTAKGGLHYFGIKDSPEGIEKSMEYILLMQHAGAKERRLCRSNCMARAIQIQEAIRLGVDPEKCLCEIARVREMLRSGNC